MRVALIEKPGEPEKAFKIVEKEDPVPKKDEALIKVLYCGINHLDLWQRRGSRIFAEQYPRIPGSDAVGIVEKIEGSYGDVREGDYVVIAPGWGDGICTRCLVGKEDECENYKVLGYHVPGCYAEKIVVPLKALYKIPEKKISEKNLIELAAIPLTFTTAFHGLVTKAEISPGDKVFIWSASGGVGVASIKISKLYNAYVVAHTRSKEKADVLKELGADKVVVGEYEDLNKEKIGEEFDIVVDYIGAKTFNKSIEILRRGGKLIFFGVTSGYETTLNLRILYTKRISIHNIYIGSRWEFIKIIDLYLRDMYKPYIFKVLPLEQVVEAHKILEKGLVTGKIILRH